MKHVAKRIVVALLGWQVRRLCAKNDFKIVAVVGSYGKTSTKLAIAQALQSRQRVMYQQGNYNDISTVPLVFFGQRQPSLFNPFAWARVFAANERAISKPYHFDVVVLELGTDGPGQIKQFANYLRVDIAVVTAIAPEHMEFFGSIDNVAKEELSVSEFSSTIIVNSDLVPGEYLGLLSANMVLGYGLQSGDYKGSYQKNLLSITHEHNVLAALCVVLSSKALQYSTIAAATICHLLLGMDQAELDKAVAKIKPVAGRMQMLQGIKSSTIIDDSYNASPDAMIGALEALYAMESPQKIALLGNMNELGEFSQQAHDQVGAYCDPRQVDLVITLGPDANKWLAEAAENNGCKVIRTTNPYEAADVIKQNLQKGAAILVKGSQNNVYAEEAVKQLLSNSSDIAKLVRQSNSWQEIKSKNFEYEDE